MPDRSHPEFAPVQDIAQRFEKHFGTAPELAIVLGSGLGPVVDAMRDTQEVSFTELGLPQSTVAGHAGHAIVGHFAGRRTLIMSGRVHAYEGLPMPQLVRGVRAMHLWGVKHLLLTNSAGGISQGLEPGEVVMITDHLNLLGDSPLRGPAYATRFPDMGNAYSSRMRKILATVAEREGIPLHSGVYAATMGPSYETPAEVQAAHRMGADMVGMSTVPEILAAAELGFEATAITVVSNRAAGLSDEFLTHEEVQVIAGRAARRVVALLEGAVPEWVA